MRADVAAVTTPARLGESPVWDVARSRLMWVDLLAGTVNEFDPTTGEGMAARVEPAVTALGLCAGGDRYVVAAGMGVATCTWPGTNLHRVALVDRGERMNDGKPDPAGRLVVGTMTGDHNPGQAALYQIERGTVRMLLDGVTISNGLDWSPDGGTMYYVDTPLERIDAFDYDVTTGAISGRRILADLRGVPGRPDGLTVDSDGGVWVAMAHGGACVRRFTPEGQLDHVLELPVRNVTSVGFGGDGLTDLYITTSQLRMAADELARWPESGCLFRASGLGVTGLPPNRYLP